MTSLARWGRLTRRQARRSAAWFALLLVGSLGACTKNDAAKTRGSGGAGGSSREGTNGAGEAGGGGALSRAGAGGSTGSRGGSEGGADAGGGGVLNRAGASAGGASDNGGADNGGAAGAESSGWVGVWDGVSLRSDSSSTPFIAVVDPQNRVFVADGSRDIQGWGTIDVAGEIEFAVDGGLIDEVGSTLSYTGSLSGNEGAGSWESSLDTAGTWTVTRREGVEFDEGCTAQCDDLAPCLTRGTDPVDRMLGACLVTCAIPSPSEVILRDRFMGCLPADSCADLDACFVAGTQDDVYVSLTGDDANDGATPTTPKRTVNEAPGEVNGDGTVHVAAGTYAENLVVSKSVTLLGGYDETFTTRNPEANPVVFNGSELDRVITVFALDENAGTLALDGLSLINGNINGSGAALSSSGLTEVSLTDCIVQGNHATTNGGGIKADHVTLTVTRCRFEDNSSDGNAGGGIDAYATNLTVVDSTFANNTTGNYGGGINLWQSQSSITGCEFEGNVAGTDGGGIAFGSTQEDDHELGTTAFTANDPNGANGSYQDLGGNTLQEP